MAKGLDHDQFPGTGGVAIGFVGGIPGDGGISTESCD